MSKQAVIEQQLKTIEALRQEIDGLRAKISSDDKIDLATVRFERDHAKDAVRRAAEELRDRLDQIVSRCYAPSPNFNPLGEIQASASILDAKIAYYAALRDLTK